MQQLDQDGCQGGMGTTDRPLRVLVVSTSYPEHAGDWRGTFIRQQVAGLASSPGIEVDLWAPPGDLPARVRAATTLDEAQWMRALMAAGGISHIMRQGGLRSALAPWRLLRMLRSLYARHTSVDVYHINWLQCALPLPGNGTPALVCVLGNDLKLLRLPLMRFFLHRALRGRRAAICPNADWMVEPLREAFGDVAHVQAVPFGIDPQWYAVQRTLPGHPRWLVVSRLTRDKIGPLLEWAAPLFQGESRTLHLFGPMQEPMDIPHWVNYHGPATPQALATEWFPNATGLISLSRHAEGRPQVMLEAMASGLPIVASDIDAHTSLITHGESGEICSNQREFANALESVETPAKNRRYAEASRQRVKAQFGTWQDCASRYVALYRRLLGPRDD